MLHRSSARWITALLAPLTAFVLPLHAGSPTGSSDLVYLATDDGVAVVDTATGEKTLAAEDAMPSGDWSLVVGAHRRPRTTTLLEVIDPTGLTPIVRKRLHGDLQVRAVSRTADLVALMPRDPDHYGRDGIYAPASRRRTRLVVSRLDGGEPRTFDLHANVEPEAFSVDGTALFVIQYRPALDPDRYRVRRLDLVSGELTDVFTNDKLIQGDMRGRAFDQAIAPDGSQVYTLYQKHTGETFVHLLDLVNHTAQCVLLPNHFGTDASAMAITATPDGRVLVVDPAVHEIAQLDPVHHGVASSRPYRAPGGDGPVVAAATNDAVFLATGDHVVQLQAPDLERGRSWTVESRVEALHVGTDGVLYVAVRDRLLAMALEGFSRPGDPLLDVEVDGIRSIGDSLPVTAKGTVECAC